MDTNLIIQSLWVGDRLSAMEKMCIESYLQNDHEFHLYTYGPLQGIPSGVVVLDANEILPESEIFIDEFGGYVNLSNQFRYALLYKKGGWWVDMDTVCLKRFDFTDEFVFSSERSEPYQRALVNTTFIKSLPNAKFFRDCVDFMKVRGNKDLHWGELGVNLLSRMVFRNQLKKYIQLPDVFCPVSVYEIRHLISTTDYVLPDCAYAIHWWNEIWKRKELSKDQLFPKDSLFEKMKRKYLDGETVKDS